MTNSREINLRIARYLIGFYIIYNVFLIHIGFFVPRLSLLILLLAGALTFLSVQIKLSKELKFLITFVVYAFMTGALIAVDFNRVFSRSLVLVESLFAGVIILNVVKDEKGLSELTGIFGIGALMCVLYFFTHPDLLLATRVSLEEDFNSNTLGVMLTYGVWCIVYTLNYKSPSLLKMALTIILALLIFFIIVQTGSRKSALGSLLIVVLYVFYIVFFGAGAQMKRIYKIFMGLSILGLLVFVYIKYIDIFLESAETLFFRMGDMEGSEENRGGIIKASLQVWEENPILGVGLDNNRYHNIFKLYAHNSYVEVLACCGIIGALLLYTLFWHMISFLWKSMKQFKESIKTPSTFYICILILFYLLVNIVQINFYNQTHMFMAYFVLSYIALNNCGCKINSKNIGNE